MRGARVGPGRGLTTHLPYPISPPAQERLLALLLAWTAERAVSPGAGRALPFALLLPSYCASKRYWQDFLSALAWLRSPPAGAGAGAGSLEAQAGCFYVAPGGWVASALGIRASPAATGPGTDARTPPHAVDSPGARRPPRVGRQV